MNIKIRDERERDIRKIHVGGYTERGIHHPTQRRTQGAGIVKRWEDK